MTGEGYVLAIDQGTTSSKAIVLSRDGEIVSVSRGFSVESLYPRPGWVEFDPGQMFQSVCDAARDAVERASLSFADIAAIGLANQGETVIAFDRRNGEPIGNAISWQDRRTNAIVDQWRNRGIGDLVTARSGLRLDPYFSAAKLRWLLDHDQHAQQVLADGVLGMGTSDVWLIWMLTGGEAFVTDSATGSRTMLMDLETIRWSDELLSMFELPGQVLPRIARCDEPIGETQKELFGVSIPIAGLCVDQHAAVFGHRCFQPNQAKTTYGTGCFMLANIGDNPSLRARGLLTVLCYHLRDNVAYALEGGVYSAGSIIEWLVRLGLLNDPSQLDPVAGSVEDPGGVYLVPAFSGLAAPYWESRARACWTGLNPGTDRRHLVRSAVEAIAFRIGDIHIAMAEAGVEVKRMRVDGGLTRSQVLMQTQSDLLGIDLDARENPQVTAIGVGLMAGLGAGVWSWPDGLPVSPSGGFQYGPNENSACSLRTRHVTFARLCREAVQRDHLSQTE
jgi:glycerol kinase